MVQSRRERLAKQSNNRSLSVIVICSMPLHRYLLAMVVGTLLSGASWFLVLVFLDPATSGAIGISLFFFSFFLMVFGLASIAGYLVRQIFQRREPAFRLVGISFRQAILLAILLTASLFLQSQGYLTWWVGLLLFLFVSFIEAFFVAKHTPSTERR